MSHSKIHLVPSRTASGWLFSSFCQYSTSHLLQVWADTRWENWVLSFPCLKLVVLHLLEVLKREDSFFSFLVLRFYLHGSHKPETDLSINKHYCSYFSRLKSRPWAKGELGKGRTRAPRTQYSVHAKCDPDAGKQLIILTPNPGL